MTLAFSIANEGEGMENRVTPSIAAAELGMSVLTLRGLMQQGKLNIGYALKQEGKKKWSYYIYRKKLDEVKADLGIVSKEKEEN